MAFLICDLDGTLIDSREGVATALRHSFAAEGIEAQIALDASILGPALDDLLCRVAPQAEQSTLLRLRDRFISHYDGGAWKRCVAFDGVSDMLTAAQTRGHSLALATNKRLVSTRRIIEFLGWSNMFDWIETVDSRSGIHRTKSAMLSDLCNAAASEPDRTFYLGDTDADVQAAHEAGLQFILAGWGGQPSTEPPELVAGTPMTVVAFLERTGNATQTGLS